MVWCMDDLSSYCWLWRWRKGPQAIEYKWSPEAGKEKGTDSPLRKDPEGAQPPRHLGVSPVYHQSGFTRETDPKEIDHEELAQVVLVLRSPTVCHGQVRDPGKLEQVRKSTTVSAWHKQCES